jgi:hypothetical protein
MLKYPSPQNILIRTSDPILVEGIKMGLNQLRSWKIEHVKRDANKATHIIAKEASYHKV